MREEGQLCQPNRGQEGLGPLVGMQGLQAPRWTWEPRGNSHLDPALRGLPRLAREQTACDLGAGPVSSPLAIPPDWKGHGQTPQLKRQTGTQKKPPEAQRLIDGVMVPREAGGTQNKLWHRLILVPASSHWAGPETRPYSCRPAAAFQPSPRLSSLQPGSVSSLRETLCPQLVLHPPGTHGLCSIRKAQPPRRLGK